MKCEMYTISKNDINGQCKFDSTRSGLCNGPGMECKQVLKYVMVEAVLRPV